MNVIVKYFNKRRGTIEALQDFKTMKSILENTDEEVKVSYDKLIGLGSPRITGMPSAHNPKAGEDRLVKGLDNITLLRDRYADAKEYMDWFTPAWNDLTDDEKYVLRICYADKLSMTDAIEAICSHFCIERSSAYNKKNRAINRLSVLLFGK